MQVLVELLDTFGTIVAFGNHLHFNLGALDRIPLSNHGTEHTVTAEIGIGGNQQVAQISRILDGTFHRMDCLEESVHFLDGVRNKYCLKVISILQATADTSSDSIDVLQDRCIFNARYILAHRSLDVVTG